MLFREAGAGVAHIPTGVYGFTYSPQQEAPLFQKTMYRIFEVHKLRDGSVEVIGFVTEQEAASISASRETIGVTVYPDSQGDSVRAVSIPMSKVLEIKGPLRDRGYELKIELSPDHVE